MPHDQHETATGFNVARYSVEHRHISWVLFAGVLAWGVGAYQAMPKRKDPDIPVRQVAVATPWPGQSAERVEQLVTRKIEEKLAQNVKVSEIKSRSRAGLSVVYAEVDESVTDTEKKFDNIKIKLDSLTELPQRADLHPDVWDPIVIAPAAPVRQSLREKAGAKYSYRELDDFTEHIERAVRGVPEVSRVTRVGLLEEQVELLYSQNRIAGYGIVPGIIPAALEKRNTTIPAGTLNTGGRSIELEQTNEFRTLADIDRTAIGQAGNGTLLHLRDLGIARRGYQHPARFHSFYTHRDDA